MLFASHSTSPVSKNSITPLTWDLGHRFGGRQRKARGRGAIGPNPRVPHCGSLDVAGHQRNLRRIRERACGYPTVLLWHQRRFRCRDCRRTCRERHPQIAERRSVTTRFRKCLFERAVSELFAWVAASEEVSGHRVVEAFDAYACDELAGPPGWFPRVVNLDESAFRRMFRYHTVFFDPERGEVFELVEDRSQAAAELGFSLMSPAIRAGIESVVVDCFLPTGAPHRGGCRGRASCSTSSTPG